MSNILGQLISKASGQKEPGGRSSKPTLIDKASDALTGQKHSQGNQNQIGRESNAYNKANNGHASYNGGFGGFNNGPGGYNSAHGSYNGGRGGFGGSH